ncbi:uncharacterized protein LOC127557355 [Antechinus flavipes]|uniref:uncharacterized protein LOC127557355 n=1 Tax=Antechinus flavipes TaxID=38775 RepID=UPI002236B329|nr:uncharacterized protein LOC127557355 [Antechinus flavipes]
MIKVPPFLKKFFFHFHSPLCRPYAFPVLRLFLLPPSSPLSPFSSCSLSLPLPSSCRLVCRRPSTAPGSLETNSVDPSVAQEDRGSRAGAGFHTGRWEQRGQTLGAVHRGRQELGSSPCPPRNGKSRGPAEVPEGAEATAKSVKYGGVPAPLSPSTLFPGAVAPGYPTSCGSSWDCGWMLQLQETQLRGRLLCWERRRCNIFKVSQTLWLHWPPWS